MSDNQLSESNHVCFALPEDLPASPKGPWDERSLEAPMKEGQLRPDGRSDNLLSGLSTQGAEGLSRIVPTMMCGEESAVHVFQKEAIRVENSQAAAAGSSLLLQISAEEAVHERLLQQMRACLPVPDDLASLRRRARYFFFRIASRDPATHFARIVGLDSGVCITLSCMLEPSTALAKAPAASQIWSRIWRDEARHVRISRQHVVDLGIDQAKLVEESRQMRGSYAELLVLPLSDDFERMGVDPDRLYRRIVGPESV